VLTSVVVVAGGEVVVVVSGSVVSGVDVAVLVVTVAVDDGPLDEVAGPVVEGAGVASVDGAGLVVEPALGPGSPLEASSSPIVHPVKAAATTSPARIDRCGAITLPSRPDAPVNVSVSVRWVRRSVGHSGGATLVEVLEGLSTLCSSWA
jgi:hypothetical protein